MMRSRAWDYSKSCRKQDFMSVIRVPRSTNLMQVPVKRDRTFPEERHETGFPCWQDCLCGTEKACV